MKALDDRDEILHIDLKGRDPDDGVTRIPYEKGALFVRHLEEVWGRDRFDRFVRGYFDHFAFKSITTAEFAEYLKSNLFSQDRELSAKVPLDEWLYKPGLPSSAPHPTSDSLTRVEESAKGWLAGSQPLSKAATAAWTTQEWLHFLRTLPEEVPVARLSELDRTFKFTESGNSEIAHQWLLMAIRNRYQAAMPRLEQYLITIGRRKLVKPLYEELVKTPEGKKRAEAIYRKARPGYHPLTVASIDQVMKL